MTNWLINPQQTVATDDTDTVFWKSRDIVMNETVFVNRPTSTHFLNHLDFQCWKIYNSIDLPMYFVSRGLKKNMIDIVDVFICEERQQIYVVREGFYNDEVGIQFPKEDDVFL
jgi:CRISPR-associated endonuclease/helicase Cas3